MKFRIAAALKCRGFHHALRRAEYPQCAKEIRGLARGK
jgi:hypothetical protein